MLAPGIRFQPSNIGGLSITNKHRGQHQTRDIMNIIGDIMGCETNSIKWRYFNIVVYFNEETDIKWWSTMGCWGCWWLGREDLLDSNLSCLGRSWNVYHNKHFSPRGDAVRKRSRCCGEFAPLWSLEFPKSWFRIARPATHQHWLLGKENMLHHATSCHGISRFWCQTAQI